ncbi:MAG: helix-turn-helix transcriptional regulator [Bacteroidia bacterium]|nr:helix-turn-helix transcriptional regulator [Bacteroidia bacterium]
MAVTDNILTDISETDNYLPLLDDFNPKAIAHQIARNMKQRRLDADLSQQALAKRSGVALGTLKRFESQSEISLKHLLMIAVTLGATDEFHRLFAQKQYQSIDELMKVKEPKTRKRGRKNA